MAYYLVPETPCVGHMSIPLPESEGKASIRVSEFQQIRLNCRCGLITVGGEAEGLQRVRVWVKSQLAWGKARLKLRCHTKSVVFLTRPGACVRIGGGVGWGEHHLKSRSGQSPMVSVEITSRHQLAG